ncbi:MAG: flagellar basal body-associated FliL family protein [Gemmatimonadales bacterium]|nr:flagellar basal body-associated FliL family protein [Gemmatimonadales bacterium]
MATTPAAADSPDATDAPAKPGMVPMIATVLVALLAGGGVGAYAVGPMLGPASPAAAKEEGGGGHGGEEEGGSAHLFKLDGVIVNPAGSRGQHHLITTVAYEVEAIEDEPRLRAAEVELRDHVSALLERKTLDQLTAPGIRDQLRSELRALAEPYLKAGSVKVFLPQYIVQ